MTQTAVIDRSRIKNLVAAIACVTVFGFALGEMFPLLSLIMEREGVRADVIGYNTSMAPVGILFAGFIVPPLVARLGARVVALGAAALAAFIVLLYPLTPIFWGWFFLRFAQGIAVSTLFSVSEAWVIQFAEGPYRTRILGLYASVLALSFGLGPGVIAITGTDGALPFWVGAAVLLAASLPIMMVREEAAKGHEGAGAASFFTFAPRAPVLLLAVGAFAVFDSACLGFLPVYGVRHGMSEREAAILLSVLSFGNVGLQLPIGWLGDKYPKRRVMAGLAIVTMVFTALIPSAMGTVWLWPLLMLVGATSVGIYTIALAEVGERFSGADLVAGTSAMATTWGLGALVGAMVAGWAFQTFGPDGFPYSLAILFAVFLLLMWLRERWKTAHGVR